MVRAGNDNELADTVRQERVVAIGWDLMGDVTGLKGREDFKERYRETNPDETSENRLVVNAGQVYRFAREIEEGHYILTYLKASREVLIGVVAGPYEYRDDAFLGHYYHVRRVQWLKSVSRDGFSPAARNSLGSTLTVFSVRDHLDEIHALATAAGKPPLHEAEAEPPFIDEVKAKADELIADLVSGLAPYDFQDMVAALLRAMGFQAVSAPPGPDRGVDIVAHPDAFGFGRPRIKVQVKHRGGAVGGPELRSFLGTLREDDNGLYVSTGGFTNEARLAAEHSRHPLSLLDRDDLIRLLLEHYEALEPEFKARVPLRRVWLPAK